MTNIEILTAFETEIGKIDDEFTKPATDDSLFWLNQAVNKFVKTRFNGDFVHKTGFEETEKRRNDLINLFKKKSYSSFTVTQSSSYDQCSVIYPTDFLYALSEDVVISNTDGENQMDTCVFECTQDSFMYRVNNMLTDFHYRYKRARPIRIRTKEGCLLLTDKNYKIKKYILGYLKAPDEITLENPYSEYSEFDDSTMYEIIKIAALMYLENTENKRYNTITSEVMTQE